MAKKETAPKLFISYSWTSPQHVQWVVQLAEKLRDSGVDAILDKWDLKEGHDVTKFMEKMVTDSTIDKVLMVVDKNYAEKANSGVGGVGTETQIISKGVYENKGQEKFVALVLDKDANGKPYLPLYFQSRIYIDFSESHGEKEFEKLLRWIFGKPLDVKPVLGKRPAFVSDETRIDIPTNTAQRDAIKAIKDDKGNSSGYVTDYLESLSVGLESFRINNIEELKEPFDDAVIESIENFTPYRVEFIELLLTIVKYGQGNNYAEILHKFFEELIPYLDIPKGYTGSVDKDDQDNFKFIIHELFLYTIAILLKAEKFEAVKYLISRNYYMDYHPANGQNLMVSYHSFSQVIDSINETRKERLHPTRALLQADLLKDRSQYAGLDFLYLVQADFILLMKTELAPTDLDKSSWHPVPLLYTESSYRRAFPIFVRSESREYFDRVKFLLGINNKDDISLLLDVYKSGKKPRPRVGITFPDLKSLINFDKLATTP